MLQPDAIDSEDEEGEDQGDSKESSRKRARPGDPASLAKCMESVRHAKTTALKTFAKSTSKATEKFLAERKLTETTHPEYVINARALSAAERETAELQLKDAHAQLDAVFEQFVAKIRAIRDIERVLNPCEFANPAIVALAVSAPSVSWSIHEFGSMPFPKLAATVRGTFEACFADKDMASNRLKRRRRK